MPDETLFEKAGEVRESLFRWRFKQALGNQENINNIRTARKDLARIKTELRAREIEREGGTGKQRGSRAERKVRTARRLRGASRQEQKRS